MEIRLGSWRLSLTQPDVSTALLMDVYSQRAGKWQGTTARLGMDRAYQRLFSRLPRLCRPTARVLDLGAGAGALARGFHQAYPDARLTLLDLNTDMLDQAVASLDFPVDIVHANAAHYRPREAPYDLLISAHLAEHFDDLPALFRQWRRCVTHHGLLVLVHTRRSISGASLQVPWKLNVMRQASLEQALESGGFAPVCSAPLPGLIAGRLSRVTVARACRYTTPDSRKASICAWS